MSRGVGEAEGVAQDIGVTIKGLGRRRVGDQAVGTDEFAQGRVVVAGLIVVQPQAGVPALAGVHGDMYEVAGGGAVLCPAFLAPGGVVLWGTNGAIGPDDHGGTAQVVSQQEGDGTLQSLPFAHGNNLPAKSVARFIPSPKN